MKKGGEIPRTLFWDSGADHIDLQQNKEYVIERVLDLGDDEAVRWLFSKYPRRDIKRVLDKSRRISRKSFNYWSLIFKK